jgi:pilus assembly protein CpaE
MSDLHSAPALPSGRLAAPTAKLFVLDSETEDVLRQALNDIGVYDAEFTRGTIETATAALAREATPRLLVVDISGVEDPLRRIEELAARCEPEVNVVAIGDRNDIILYRQLKNVGVTEYFFKPLVRDMVKRVCHQILSGGYDEKSGNPRGGKLVFVLGVRGGVGATTIAVNAAWRLANKGQRWVMLVDMDLEGGDAALQLDASPSNALQEALEKPERVDKLFLERGTLHIGQRLDLLASVQPLGARIAVKEDAFRGLIDKLLQRYRFVFVDLPVTTAGRLIDTLHQPSTCILVSNASLASVRELVRWRDWLGPNTSERRTMHILNMSGADAGLPEAEFLRAAGQAPDIIIPYNRDVAIASNLGVKATQKCAALDRGVAKLLRDLAGEPAATPRSVLSRIFG